MIKKKTWIFVFLLLISLYLISADRIDLIKSIDSNIPTMISQQNLTAFPFYFHNKANDNYGSVDVDCWNSSSCGNSGHHNKVTGFACWRYDQNFTDDLGYDDTYYLDSELKDLCILTGDYLTRSQIGGGQIPNGVHSWIAKDFAVAYNTTKYWLPDREHIILYTDAYPDREQTWADDLSKGYNTYLRGTDTANLTRHINCSLPEQNISSPYFVSANVTVPLVKIESLSVGDLYIFFNFSDNNGAWNHTEPNTSWAGVNTYYNVSFEINKSWLQCGDNDIRISQEVPGSGSVEHRLLFDPNNSGYTVRNSGVAAHEVHFDMNLYFNRSGEWENSIKEAMQFKLDFQNASSNNACKNLFYKNANQGAFDIEFAGIMYSIFGNTSYTDFADECLDVAHIYYPDGSMGERNSFILYSNDNNTISDRMFSGFDSNYQHSTLNSLGKYANITGSSVAATMIQEIIDFFSKFVTRGDHYYPKGSVSRISTTFSVDQGQTLPYVYGYLYANTSDETVKRLLNATLSNYTFVNLSSYTSCNRGCSAYWMDAYNNYHGISNSNTPLGIENSSRYLEVTNVSDKQSRNRAEYFVAKTKNYAAWGSIAGASPSGGILSTVQLFADNSILFSGNGSNSQFGVGNLNLGGRTNAWDVDPSTVTYSQTYPFTVFVSGTLRPRNQSNIGDYHYDTDIDTRTASYRLDTEQNLTKTFNVTDLSLYIDSEFIVRKIRKYGTIPSDVRVKYQFNNANSIYSINPADMVEQEIDFILDLNRSELNNGTNNVTFFVTGTGVNSSSDNYFRIDYGNYTVSYNDSYGSGHLYNGTTEGCLMIDFYFYTVGITYNTTYTFYDDYIDVEQYTSNITEMQIWSISTEDIGNGTIKAYNNLKLNNVTFYPQFNLTYNDSSQNSSWGIVDKLNASGTSFLYQLGITSNYTAPTYYCGNDTISWNLTGCVCPPDMWKNLDSGFCVYYPRAGVIPPGGHIGDPPISNDTSTTNPFQEFIDNVIDFLSGEDSNSTIVSNETVVFSGGSLKKALRNWNPSVYDQLIATLKKLFSSNSLLEFFRLLIQFIILLIKYIFKQPATLVAGSGL